MEKVGIIFAMEEELLALKEYLVLEKEYDIFNLKFYEGKINGIDCVLVESGIGKVNAARTAQILIDKFDIDVIINVGAAASANDELDIGDIVFGERLVQHDFDITAFGHPKGHISNVGQFIECDEKSIEKMQQIILIVQFHLFYLHLDLYYILSQILKKINQGTCFLNAVAVKYKYR